MSGAERAEILLTKPIVQDAMEALVSHFSLLRLDEAKDPNAFLAEVGPRVRGLAVGGAAPVGPALFDRLPHLEIVANFGVGYDSIDVVEAAQRGIIVTNTPDVLTEDVADLAIGLLLATIRQIPQSDRFLRAGHWPKGPHPLTGTLRGRKVGILGLGRIGRAIARRLEGFGVALAYYGRRRQADVPYTYYDTLHAMAAAVDVLMVVAPSNAETRHIVDAAVLDALGPEGVVVNVARGSLIDEAALIEALQSRRIHSAGLDVFAAEPYVPAALAALDHVVLLPHVGSASWHTRRAMGALLVENMMSWFAGKGPVTPVAETPWSPAI